jgi:hypothetical protein
VDLTLPLVLQANGFLTNQGTLTLDQFSPVNIVAGTFHNTATGLLTVLADAISVGSGVTFIEDGDLRGAGQPADTIGAFTVNSGGMVTHSQGLVTGLSFIVTGTLTVHTGGAIDVTGKGLLGATSPSLEGQTVLGLTGSSGTAGGSYGGLGGVGSGGIANPAYGSETAPADLGSGGGRTVTGANGGNGGGRIAITAGDFIINGVITADGATASFNAGGGSGGSIHLTLTGSGGVSGTGLIRANGGFNLSGGAGGGGGRVALVDFATLTLAGSNIRAHPGNAGFDGSAGTVYLESAAQGDGAGDLILDAGNVSGAQPAVLNAGMSVYDSVIVRNGPALVETGEDLTLPLVLQANGFLTNQGTLTLDQFSPVNIVAGTFHNTATGLLTVLADTVSVGSGVTFIEDGNLRGAGQPADTIGAFTVNSGGMVTHSQGLATGLSFTVTGALTVAAGGAIDVTGKGLLGATSPSLEGQTVLGLTGSSGIAGGSYGGLGGVGSGGTANPAYGSETAPADLGSGGGRAVTGANGGNGGGRVAITAAEVIVTGVIAADGSSAGLNAGGGSGGAIHLTLTGSGVVNGTGSIHANGGSNSAGGAGGGGGRVAVVGATSFFPTIVASGGLAPSGFPGTAGTVFVSPMLSGAGERVGADTGGSAPTITQSQLDRIARSALAEWGEILGRDDPRLTDLDGLSFLVTDLAGAVLGFADGNTIKIDWNAAGYGWFVDDSPEDDSEFTIRLDRNVLGAQPSSEAFGRLDLRTVVAHELGHVLGFNHYDAALYAVMREELDPGVRYVFGALSIDVSLFAVHDQGESSPTLTDSGTAAGAQGLIDWTAPSRNVWDQLSSYAIKPEKSPAVNFSDFVVETRDTHRAGRGLRPLGASLSARWRAR